MAVRSSHRGRVGAEDSRRAGRGRGDAGASARAGAARRRPPPLLRPAEALAHRPSRSRQPGLQHAAGPAPDRRGHARPAGVHLRGHRPAARGAAHHVRGPCGGAGAGDRARGGSDTARTGRRSVVPAGRGGHGGGARPRRGTPPLRSAARPAAAPRPAPAGHGRPRPASDPASRRHRRLVSGSPAARDRRAPHRLHRGAASRPAGAPGAVRRFRRLAEELVAGRRAGGTARPLAPGHRGSWSCPRIARARR